jgi:hypothetical protein
MNQYTTNQHLQAPWACPICRGKCCCCVAECPLQHRHCKAYRQARARLAARKGAASSVGNGASKKGLMSFNEVLLGGAGAARSPPGSVGSVSRGISPKEEEDSGDDDGVEGEGFDGPAVKKRKAADVAIRVAGAGVDRADSCRAAGQDERRRRSFDEKADVGARAAAPSNRQWICEVSPGPEPNLGVQWGRGPPCPITRCWPQAPAPAAEVGGSMFGRKKLRPLLPTAATTRPALKPQGADAEALMHARPPPTAADVAWSDEIPPSPRAAGRLDLACKEDRLDDATHLTRYATEDAWWRESLPPQPQPVAALLAAQAIGNSAVWSSAHLRGPRIKPYLGDLEH